MYQVLVNRKLGKRLEKFPESEQAKIRKVLKQLSESPLPKGLDLKKLRSKKFPIWRVRIGNLRIIYSYSAKEKTIRVTNIGFRGGVY